MSMIKLKVVHFIYNQKFIELKNVLIKNLKYHHQLKIQNDINKKKIRVMQIRVKIFSFFMFLYLVFVFFLIYEINTHITVANVIV